MTGTIVSTQACDCDEALAGVIRLLDDVMRSGTGQSMLSDYPRVFARENWPCMRLVRDNDQVVSVVTFIMHAACVAGQTMRLAVISPTATHPQHRGRGYASACMESCIALMDEANVDLSILWTEPSTYPFYERFGYEPVGTQLRHAALSRKDTGLFDPGDYGIMPMQDVHQNAVGAIHDADTPSIARSPDIYATLLTLPRMQTLVAMRKEVVAGYLVISSALHRCGLVEGGGSPESLESLMYHALSQLAEHESIGASVGFEPHALSRLLDERLSGRLVACADDHTMLRISNPKTFVESLKLEDQIHDRGVLARRILRRDEDRAPKVSLLIWPLDRS